MSGMLSVGPLVLPLTLVAFIASVLMGQGVAAWLAMRRDPDTQLPMGRVLLTGILASRAAFVAQQFDAYSADPVSILDIRDGGWNATAGFAAAWAYAVWLSGHRSSWKAPMLTGIAVATLVWAGAHWVAAATGSGEPRASLPETTFRTLEGEPRSLQAFQGKPVVLNLWASWCPPCRREMPVFAQAQAAHPEITFVFLNQGERTAVVQQFLAQQGLALENVLLDVDTQAATVFGHRALPATLFFDAFGRHVDTRQGELSRATLAQRLALISHAPAPHTSKEMLP
ncbi:TlpA family protein disulfide reductase [Achromobacter aegrifaciens]|uniref:Thiol-disulfide oxidoreductase resA n=1 Tax=Achromobacter aegrifaciens TaxID=1287736 RepID=A0AAD2J4J1_ACHAE|nr:TlpA disulfide reductase family protein [Achromobacter aegrifaciens]CUJ69607.1 Thiol-disulfide oxidoreductase resA [Achromobacter aegrifaciens]